MALVDASTIRCLIAGEETAFRAVYEAYSEQVYRLAFRFLKDNEWSEESVQDVFLKLWLNREGLDEDGNIWVYLYVMTKRLCLNKLREIRKSSLLFERLMQHMDVPASNRTEAQLETEELERRAQHLIATLPKQQQLIFKLSREEGLSHNEIAQRLGLSPNTVKNHMVQALKTLRNSLQQSGYTYLLACVFYSLAAN